MPPDNGQSISVVINYGAVYIPVKRPPQRRVEDVPAMIKIPVFYNGKMRLRMIDCFRSVGLSVGVEAGRIFLSLFFFSSCMNI
jgi:hypothetical protein